MEWNSARSLHQESQSIWMSSISQRFNNPRWQKNQAKNIACVMIGYDSLQRGIYRLWNIQKEQVIISRDVKFIEDEFYTENLLNIQSNNLRVPSENTPLYPYRTQNSYDDNVNNNNPHHEPIWPNYINPNTLQINPSDP